MRRGGVLSLWRGVLTRPAAPEPTLASLAEDVCAEHGCTVELLRGARAFPELVRARRVLAERAVAAGHSGAATARFLLRDPSTVNGALARREFRQ